LFNPDLYFTGLNYYGSAFNPSVGGYWSGVAGQTFSITSVHGGVYGTVSTEIFDLVIGRNSDCWSTPYIPTPTPSALGYCSSVSTSDADTGFSFSGIQFGSISCFDIGGPTYDNTEFNATSILTGLYDTVLYIFTGTLRDNWIAHICLQEVNLGVIQIFDVTISLTLIAYVVGITLLIRELFSS
jgi:hypothetical protein